LEEKLEVVLLEAVELGADSMIHMIQIRLDTLCNMLK
jgi:hypothetical protein